MTVHRAPSSVWDRSGWNGSHAQATATRWLIGGGGVAMALQGMRHRGLTRAMLTGLGSTLAWWAATSDGDVADAMCRLRAIAGRLRGAGEDPVHDASADSFPASDAPSFTSTVGTGVRRGVQ